MRRIAIIADNSCTYVRIILESWNRNETLVLIDVRIPITPCIEMLDKADVKAVYTDKEDLYNYLRQNRKDLDVKFLNPEYSVVQIPCAVKSLYKKRYDNAEAVVLFSSGTTGNCKGIRLSHYAITMNAEKNAAQKRVDTTSVLYIYKTLSHCASFIGELLLGLIKDSKVYISSTRTILRMHLENIYKYKVTHFSINPSVLQMIMRNEKGKYDYSSLLLVACSGGLLEEKNAKNIQKYFGCEIINMYGMTEASSLFSCQKLKKGMVIKDNFVSVGMPLQGNKVKIWNYEKNIQAKIGEIGEVLIVTSTLMLGYLETTIVDVDNEGYWKTGDVGYINENGELFIVGRKDRMIISCGHNVYPEYIEYLIKQSGLVDECIVFGKKDEIYGEKICCMYTCQNYKDDVGMLLKNECMRHLAQYEVPQNFVRCTELKRTSTGKLVVREEELK